MGRCLWEIHVLVISCFYVTYTVNLLWKHAHGNNAGNVIDMLVCYTIEISIYMKAITITKLNIYSSIDTSLQCTFRKKC